MLKQKWRSRYGRPMVAVAALGLRALMVVGVAHAQVLDPTAVDPCVPPYAAPETACGVTTSADTFGFLGAPGDANWYRLNASDGLAVGLYLVDLTADYDLYLFDENANLIAQSAQSDVTPEAIELTLSPAGTYYLQVLSDPNKGVDVDASTPYHLQVSLSGPLVLPAPPVLPTEPQTEPAVPTEPLPVLPSVPLPAPILPAQPPAAVGPTLSPSTSSQPSTSSEPSTSAPSAPTAITAPAAPTVAPSQPQPTPTATTRPASSGTVTPSQPPPTPTTAPAVGPTPNAATRPILPGAPNPIDPDLLRTSPRDASITRVDSRNSVRTPPQTLNQPSQIQGR